MDKVPPKLQGYRKGQSRPMRDTSEPDEPDPNWHPGKPENLRPDPGLTVLVCAVFALVIIVSVVVYLATGPHSMHPLLP